ncbi:MAG: hypothetical protein RSD81_04915 [Pseudomonas sp.]
MKFYLPVLAIALLAGCGEQNKVAAPTAATEKMTSIELKDGNKVQLNGELIATNRKAIESGEIVQNNLKYKTSKEAALGDVEEKLKALGYASSQQSTDNPNTIKYHFIKKSSPTIGTLISEKEENGEKSTRLNLYWQEQQ